MECALAEKRKLSAGTSPSPPLKKCRRCLSELDEQMAARRNARHAPFCLLPRRTPRAPDGQLEPEGNRGGRERRLTLERPFHALAGQHVGKTLKRDGCVRSRVCGFHARAEVKRYTLTFVFTELLVIKKKKINKNQSSILSVVKRLNKSPECGNGRDVRPPHHGF